MYRGGTMKKITYTQMRSELSSILDDVRNGESIEVTQRGKPNLILKAISEVETGDKISTDTSKNTQASTNFDESVSKINTDAIARLREQTKRVENLLPPGLREQAKRVEKLLPKGGNLEALNRVMERYRTALETGKLTKPINEPRKTLNQSENVSRKEEFEESLAYTKERYADVIKLLEDK